MSGKDWRNPDHVRLESHVEVPLVIDFEGLHATANWMLGEFRELRRPMWIDGPMSLEISADPIEERSTSRVFRDFHGIMDAR